MPAADMAHRMGRASQALDSQVAQAVAAMTGEYAQLRDGLVAHAPQLDALEREDAKSVALAANRRILDARTGVFRACDAALDAPAS